VKVQTFAPAGLTAPPEILGSQDSETGAGTGLCPLPAAQNANARETPRPQNPLRSPRGAHAKTELLITDFELRSMTLEHAGLTIPCSLVPNMLRLRHDMATHCLRVQGAPNTPDLDLAAVWITSHDIALLGEVCRILLVFAAGTPLAGRRFMLVGREGATWCQYELTRGR
jgi:hypothetical protein